MEREKVILDVDTANMMPIRDIDDGLAIALALSSPEIDLLGLTTCGGNCRTEESTYNSLIWLEQAGRGDIPVAEGRLEPFLEEVGPNFEFWDKRSEQMADLWKDVPSYPAPTIEKSPLPAHEFIIEMVRKYPGEVNIVKEGALTNLALALLVEPEIAPLVKSVIHMGGTFHRGSGLDMREPIWSYPNGTFWRHFLRMNTEFDPLATEIVVRSGIPFYFVTGAVTSRVFLRKQHIEQIAAVGTPYHDFVADTSRPWVDLDVDLRDKPGSFMHDPLALAILIDPTFVTFVKMHCDLERFHKMDYPYLYVSPDSPQAYVSVDVDVDRFEKFLADRLSAPVIMPGS